MARKQPDYVVEAVHYAPTGQVEWVRGYERRGIAYSDLIVLSREELVRRLRAGQRIVIGQRKPYMGHTFEVQAPVQLVSRNGNEVIAAEGAAGEQDNVPAPRV